MCIVTRQINQIQDGWREDAGREIERTFSQLTAEAERTRSLLKLLPLSNEVRKSYLLQVLQERYSYSGDQSGVPHQLVHFMSERAAGNPKYIEETLAELHKANLLNFQLDDEGDEGGGMVVEPLSLETLRAVPAPKKMVATVLQQFDMLEPQLQRVLKAVSPLGAFSAGMLVDIGLPGHIFRRLVYWFNLATDEGILEQATPIPEEVLSADPSAQNAWRWLLCLMRDQVLANLLHAERNNVEEKVEHLRAYNRARLSQRPPPTRWGTCTNLEDSLLEDISEDEPSSSNIAVRLAAERRRCKELEEELSRMKADMKKHPAAPRSAACTIC